MVYNHSDNGDLGYDLYKNNRMIISIIRYTDTYSSLF